MAKVTTMVLGAVIIGSATNDEWRMGLLTTDIGIFSINSNEAPEEVDKIALLRVGDQVDLDVYGKFDAKPRRIASGDEIYEATCDKFMIADVRAGSEQKEITGLAGRTPKSKVVRGQGKENPLGQQVDEKELLSSGDAV